jgi:hypothetical protein
MLGFSGINKYLLGLIALLTFAGYVMFDSLVDTRAELATANASILAYKDKIAQNEAIRRSFELSHKNLTIMYQRAESQNRKDKGREHVAVSKPNLVEKLANTKFRKNQRELACITGNEEKCD